MKNELNFEYKSLADTIYEDKELDKPFELDDFAHSEMELDSILEAEVVNPDCVYYAETVWVTAKAYALNRAWFKCELGYEPAEYDGCNVWLRADELEFV